MLPGRHLVALLLLWSAFADLCFAADIWKVRDDGVGPVEIGITLAQLNAALYETFAMPADKEAQGCFYVTPKKHPKISFMIENGRVARVDVNHPGVLTSEGIQVGDAEARVKEVYGARLTIEPHKYTDGHYLTVRSSAGGYGVRFETDRGKITTYYAGLYDAIRLVERCG